MTDVRCSDIQAKNFDVRFRCLMIVSRLARRPTVAIWMCMGGSDILVIEIILVIVIVTFCLIILVII